MPRDCTEQPRQSINLGALDEQSRCHAVSNTMAKSKKSKRNTNINNKKKTQTQVRTVYVDKPIPSIGAQIGDKLQKLGESLFTRFMGTGDYSVNDGCMDVSKNALIKGSEARAVKMGSDKGTFVFEHSEYIGDVVTSSTIGAFSSTSYTINPQSNTTFPWLSNLAPNFESYEIEGMLFRFESTSGESVASTNTAIGSVMGTVQYDALDPAFVSKQQLLQYDNTVDCRFSKNFICGVECDTTKLPVPLRKLYIGPVAAGADAKFYNYGTFVVATQGAQAASVNIGELWVSYRIRFYITKDTNYAVGSSHFATNSGNVSASPYTNVKSNQGTLTPVATGGSTLTYNNVQVGAYYLLTIVQTASASSTFTSSSVTLTGFSLIALINADISSSSVDSTITAQTAANYVATLKCTSPTASISGAPYNCTNTFSVDVFLSQLDSSIIN